MHQLRVHLAEIGRPILGDARYGGALTMAGQSVPRLMLHAAALAFPHPDGGMKKIEAPAPEDFVEVARRAGVVVGADPRPPNPEGNRKARRAKLFGTAEAEAEPEA